jgi:hypothetical protein
MCISKVELAEAVSEADQLDLVDPESLRDQLDVLPSRPGAGRVRQLLDRNTFALTDTRLEQLALPVWPSL